MGAQMKGVQLSNTIAWEQFYKEVPKQPFLLISSGDKDSLQFAEKCSSTMILWDSIGKCVTLTSVSHRLMKWEHNHFLQFSISYSEKLATNVSKSDIHIACGQAVVYVYCLSWCIYVSFALALVHMLFAAIVQSLIDSDSTVNTCNKCKQFWQENKSDRYIWLNCYCWGNSSIPEGRFSKWF